MNGTRASTRASAAALGGGGPSKKSRDGLSSLCDALQGDHDGMKAPFDGSEGPSPVTPEASVHTAAEGQQATNGVGAASASNEDKWVEKEAFVSVHDMIHAAIVPGGQASLRQIYQMCEERGRIAYKRTGGSRLITANEHWKSQIRHALYTSGRFCRATETSESWKLHPSYSGVVPQTTLVRVMPDELNATGGSEGGRGRGGGRGGGKRAAHAAQQDSMAVPSPRKKRSKLHAAAPETSAAGTDAGSAPATSAVPATPVPATPDVCSGKLPPVGAALAAVAAAAAEGAAASGRGGASGRGRRRAGVAHEAEVSSLLESMESPLTEIVLEDIASIKVLASLAPEERLKLLPMLPDCDRDSADNLHALFSSPHFAVACKQFQEVLGMGGWDPSVKTFVNATRKKRRALGKEGAWKEALFEDGPWGRKSAQDLLEADAPPPGAAAVEDPLLGCVSEASASRGGGGGRACGDGPDGDEGMMDDTSGRGSPVDLQAGSESGGETGGKNSSWGPLKKRLKEEAIAAGHMGGAVGSLVSLNTAANTPVANTPVATPGPAGRPSPLPATLRDTSRNRRKPLRGGSAAAESPAAEKVSLTSSMPKSEAERITDLASSHSFRNTGRNRRKPMNGGCASPGSVAAEVKRLGSGGADTPSSAGKAAGGGGAAGRGSDFLGELGGTASTAGSGRGAGDDGNDDTDSPAPPSSRRPRTQPMRAAAQAAVGTVLAAAAEGGGSPPSSGRGGGGGQRAASGRGHSGSRPSAGGGGGGGRGGGGGFKQAAAAVLRITMTPMTARELTQAAIEHGFIATSGKTPEFTMASSLYMDIKHKDRRSLFSKPEEGKFGLREWEG